MGYQLAVADEQETLAAGDLLQGLHRPGDLRDLSGTAVIGPVEHRDPAIAGHRDPGLHLFQVHPPVFRMPVLDLRILLVLVGVGTEHRDRCHIPVQPPHLDPELPDRRGPDRPDDLLQMRGDRIQRRRRPIIIQQRRGDPEDLLHRPRLRPLLQTHQRRRRGQPVGDHRLDHLPVGQVGDIPHRTQLIDDPGQLQPPHDLSTGHQRPQPLDQ